MIRAVCVSRPGGDFEFVNLELPEPPPGQVRIRVSACGVSPADTLAKNGSWSPVNYPRIPGHEVVGVIDKVGAAVAGWKLGQTVGVGWHGGHCFLCSSCRAGDFINCRRGEITGLTVDGGFAEYMLARQEALVHVPDGADAISTAPLLGAGLTAFNALRRSGAAGGDVVAVQGLGGVGHLALQFSKALGFYTVAVSGDSEKEDLARELGADVFINAGTHDPARTLAGFGGAKIILATSPDMESVAALVGGLGDDGRLLAASFSDDPLRVLPRDLIRGRRSVQGWPSGDPRDAEETLQFSRRHSILPMVETFALEEIEEAYRRTLEQSLRFRAVLRIPR